MKKIKVLLVDDHQLFRVGIANLLKKNEDIEVVGQAANGLEAVQIASEVIPDVILMDLQMPEYDGIEATKAITKMLPETKVLMLTVCDGDDELFQAIKNGAQGYLLKNSSGEALLQGIRQIVIGEAPLSPTIATKMLKEFKKHYEVENEVTHEKLKDVTEREKEILTLISNGFSNRQIAEQLNIAENTVKNHIRNVMQKLHIQNRVQLATLAIDMGLAKVE